MLRSWAYKHHMGHGHCQVSNLSIPLGAVGPTDWLCWSLRRLTTNEPHVVEVKGYAPGFHSCVEFTNAMCKTWGDYLSENAEGCDTAIAMSAFMLLFGRCHDVDWHLLSLFTAISNFELWFGGHFWTCAAGGWELVHVGSIGSTDLDVGVAFNFVCMKIKILKTTP
jgi:hypothetical protein